MKKNWIIVLVALLIPVALAFSGSSVDYKLYYDIDGMGLAEGTSADYKLRSNLLYQPVGQFESTDYKLYLGPYYTRITAAEEAPIVTIHSPEPKNYQMEKLWLKVTADILVNTWEYELNGGGRVPFTPNITINVAQCSNNLTVYASSGGNEGYSSVQFNALTGNVDADLDVDIFDIVLCAGAYGTTPTNPKWKQECDIITPPDGSGTIDIFDIVAMAGNYGTSC